MTGVALDLGYESPAAFATMFKRLVGIPPSHYRPWEDKSLRTGRAELPAMAPSIRTG